MYSMLTEYSALLVTEAGPSAFANIHENYYYVFVACTCFFLTIAYFYFPYVFFPHPHYILLLTRINQGN